MSKPTVAILHYSSYPIIGGVEVVIEAHVRLLTAHGYPVKLIVGEGQSFDASAAVKVIPEMRSLHKIDRRVNEELEKGELSERFAQIRDRLYHELKEELASVDLCIIHNLLTMHFNLPLTAALEKIIREGSEGQPFRAPRFIAWCHDATFKDPHYVSQWRDAYPWHLLSSALPKVKYVTISQMRRRQLSQLFKVKESQVNVISDGIDPKSFLNLSPVSLSIFDYFRLFEEDLVMFYPTRIVRRKNIELAIKITKSINERGHRASLIITSPPDPHNEDSLHYYESLKGLARELNTVKHSRSTSKHSRSTAEAVPSGSAVRQYPKGIEKKVIFLYEYKDDEGERIRVDGELLRSLYLLCDLLLFPTRGEGFGIPILESAVSHLPVVCSRIEPLTEVAGEEVLYLDLDDEPEKMAEAIIDYLNSHLTLPLFKKVLRNYTWEAIFAKKIEPLLRNYQIG